MRRPGFPLDRGSWSGAAVYLALPLAGLIFVTQCGALAAALVGWLDRPAE